MSPRFSLFGRPLIGILLTCAWFVAHADQQCALNDGDTYVALPKDGPMPALGSVKIKKGQRYEVGPLMARWIGVQANGDFVWARASIFAVSCVNTIGGESQGSRSSHPPASPPVNHSSTRNFSRTPSPDVGGCPCGSGRVCVGPRGGRYCITSGGNKRYGQ